MQNNTLFDDVDLTFVVLTQCKAKFDTAGVWIRVTSMGQDILADGVLIGPIDKLCHIAHDHVSIKVHSIFNPWDITKAVFGAPDFFCMSCVFHVKNKLIYVELLNNSEVPAFQRGLFKFFPSYKQILLILISSMNASYNSALAAASELSHGPHDVLMSHQNPNRYGSTKSMDNINPTAPLEALGSKIACFV